jgi:hypothetical protein
MKITHVFSILGACAAIALAAAACHDKHHADGAGYDTERGDFYCGQFTTCDTCTPQNGCGWCFDGDSSFCGSDANECSSEWTWEANFCRDTADASVSTSTTSDASSTTTDASSTRSDASSTTVDASDDADQ